jgi:DNA-binding MarR family transcriptional regulator
MNTQDLVAEHLKLIFQISRKIRQIEQKNLSDLGLSPTQIYILTFLSEHPDTSLNQLANFLGITPSSSSELIDKLVELQYVTREISSKDRRLVHLNITNKSRQIITKITDQKTNDFGKILGTLSKQDLMHFNRLLNKLLLNLDVQR